MREISISVSVPPFRTGGVTVLWSEGGRLVPDALAKEPKAWDYKYTRAERHGKREMQLRCEMDSSQLAGYWQLETPLEGDRPCFDGDTVGEARIFTWGWVE